MRGNTIVLSLERDSVARAGNLYQYDYGQRLILEGVELPAAYEVHFGNDELGTSKTMIGDETGVDIPDEFLTTGKNVHVWLYLHDGLTDGETEYHGMIGVIKRAKPTNQEPTPVQQDVITQTIAALDAAVDEAEAIAESIPGRIDAAFGEVTAEASTLGEGSPATASFNAETKVLSIGVPKGDTGEAGVSPTANVTKIGRDAVITITDASGTTTATVSDAEYTDLIDDSAGIGVTDRSWSANKLAGEFNGKMNASLKGTANGVAELDADGFVPSSQLPSYVDDILEFEDSELFPEVGEAGKIYVALDTNQTYRWGGSAYVEISSSLALGETSNTAYRGDRGKAAYEAAVVNPDSTPTYASQDLVRSGGVYSELYLKAPKENPVFTGSVSMGRASGSTVGSNSVAIGQNLTASGVISFAEGYFNQATGNYSHAEGSGSTASGSTSHAEGNSAASGNFSHAEGNGTRAAGRASHSEGIGGSNYGALGNADHAEGYQTIANSGTGDDRYAAHAEGVSTQAIAIAAHAEGWSTVALETAAHAEGRGTTASGLYAHAEGVGTTSSAFGSHAEGSNTTASANGAHSEGANTIAAGTNSHAEGLCNASGKGALGKADHAEGYNTLANSGSAPNYYGAHAEGNATQATADGAHAEGYNTRATAQAAHAEGYSTQATYPYSHAEGNYTQATSSESHAEGNYTKAAGICSHAEGSYSEANGSQAHAEGSNTKANGSQAHAEGSNTKANGADSHSGGRYTTATGRCQHVFGINNAIDEKVTITIPSSLDDIDAFDPFRDFYYMGDIVKVDGTAWVCHNPVGNVKRGAPDTDIYNWHVVESVQEEPPEWVNGTYAQNSYVKYTDYTGTTKYYQNHNAITNVAVIPGVGDGTIDWHTQALGSTYQMDAKHVEIVGGGSVIYRANIRALDWHGNEYLAGDLYIGCGSDSSGGNKVARLIDIPTLPAVATTAETQAIITEYGVSA